MSSTYGRNISFQMTIYNISAQKSVPSVEEESLKADLIGAEKRIEHLSEVNYKFHEYDRYFG